MKKYFGTDGIRGIPGESLKEEIVTKIFSSVEKILAPKSVAIILDTRESCGMITECPEKMNLNACAEPPRHSESLRVH